MTEHVLSSPEGEKPEERVPAGPVDDTATGPDTDGLATGSPASTPSPLKSASGLPGTLQSWRVAAAAAARGWLSKPIAQSRLLIVIGAAVILTIGVGTALGIATSRANTLTAELSTETGKFDSSQSALKAKSSEVDSLKTTVAAWKTRESALTAGEAASTKRSGELDAREAAVKATETTIAANTIAGDGTFRVGVDIQPGQYHSAGGSRCYWARLNATGDDIIDNNISAGPSILTVQPSDGLIKTSRCAPFTKSG